MVAVLCYGAAVLAQASDDTVQLLNRIVAASNATRPETARAVHDRCLELGEEVAARPAMVPAQRLALQAEVEACLFHALSAGQFSDAAGDACGHHFRFATLLAQAIAETEAVARGDGAPVKVMRDRLQRAGEIGAQLGCRGDYAGLLTEPAVYSGGVAAVAQGVPDNALLAAIASTTRTPDAPETWLAACRRHGDTVARRSAFDFVERAYFEAQVQNCIATAMAASKVADATGDACAYHYVYAEKLVLALLFDMELGFFDAGFREQARGELRLAIRQGPRMGCQEDFAALALD